MSDEAKRELSKEEMVELLRGGVVGWNEWREKVDPGGVERFDLGEVDLEGAQLTGANLRWVRLSGTDLRGATLTGADLVEAKLYNAKLQGANLGGADLSGADLDGAELQGADLEEATLIGAHLMGTKFKADEMAGQEAEEAGEKSSKEFWWLLGQQVAVKMSPQPKPAILRKAKLHGADLRSVDLHNTDVRDAEFTHAKLVGANLSSTTGLVAPALTGANLKHCTLPEKLDVEDGLKLVDDLSKNAGGLFVVMLAASAYCWLTYASTTDAQLITNAGSSTLPVLNTPVPMGRFYVIAPAVLVGVFCYFHMYLQRLWEAMAKFPAVFVDGRAIDEKSHAWLLNSLVRRYLPVLKEEPLPLFGLQTLLSLLLGWWLVPVTVLAYWSRYLVAHDWAGAILQIACCAVAIGGAGAFHFLTKATLQQDKVRLDAWRQKSSGLIGWTREKRRPKPKIGNSGARAEYWGRSRQSAGTKLRVLWPGVLALWGVTWVTMQYMEFKDEIDKPWVRPASSKELSSVLQFPLYATLDNSDISTRPASWTTKDGLEIVKGTKLPGLKLSYASMRGVFAAKSELAGADLNHADLSGANLALVVLSWANLEEANLVGANLNRANLEGAKLWGAEMNGAQLLEANLRGAELCQATLSGAKMAKADLEGAWLGNANFRGASLQGANLRGANLNGAKLDGADLSGADLEGANLINASLDGAILVKAKLATANLSGADLSNANLSSATMNGANLSFATLAIANLSGADLSVARLRGAWLQDSNLSGANLGSADLRDATLSGANLSRTTLFSADFHGTDLNGVDLSGAKYNKKDLEGATFNQARLQ